ncbi:MAG: hypothetical protein AAB370_12220 [Verrucomicrobiota bacterium]
MKKLLIPILLTVSAWSVPAANYLDSLGDNGAGFLDITSVDVNNTATTLTLTVNVAGDPSNAGNNWGKFLIGFDTGIGGGGNLNAVNGWGKDIQMSAGGMDYFIGSWLDWGSGADLKNWSGSQWDTVTATYLPNPYNLIFSVGTASVSYTFDLAALGLLVGSSFNFDVYASTGTANVVDSSGNPAAQTWNSDPYDSGLNVSSYTIQAVPEPTMGALLGLGSLLLLRRVTRR